MILLAPTLAAAQQAIQPGLWEVTSTVTDVELPTSAGSFTPTAYNVSGMMKVSGAQAMTMKFTGTDKLVGPCK
ncbi:hypothetical protein [Sphingomonas quercus]|uniref:DUF3617 family protein n=1 Tax=Sphingomonas quercus TaxID=2842451 RepID=A0ABS6BHI4_9SPHN|nr:hypothetical protein [Sphingomonas quercus]MBU3077760.1 hypothetical protein [Sphingomonas quercus]